MRGSTSSLEGPPGGVTPPRYRIDISKPPRERYVEVARAYTNQIRYLASIFDDLVEEVLPARCLKFLQPLARLCLRRLHTQEETEEICGIGEATGVEMWLLVAFNVLLDILMGCTSGAARAKEDPRDTDTIEESEPQSGSRMLHFRTLDWGMNALRDMVVQLDFVDGSNCSSNSEVDQLEVLASSITYVGFVGVLTGVRQDLSVSLNFRPYHDVSNILKRIRFYLGHLTVLLGFRRSISSTLRQYIIPSSAKTDMRSAPTLEMISATLPGVPTTAAYLIFCDGQSVMALEKDHRSASIQSSAEFLVMTNHDTSPNGLEHQPSPPKESPNARDDGVVTLEDVILESQSRRACMQERWEQKTKQAQRLAKQTRKEPKEAHRATRIDGLRRSKRLATVQPCYSQHAGDLDPRSGPSSSTTAVDLVPSAQSDRKVIPGPDPVTTTKRELISWLNTYPVTNEMTHFAAIMDPTRSRICWTRVYEEPVASESE